MSFDRNDPADLATLKGLVPDPTLPTQQILDDLNAETATVGIANMTASNLINAFMNDSTPLGINADIIKLMFEPASGYSDDLSRFRLQTRALSTQIGNAVDSIVRFLTLAELSFSNLDGNGVNETVTISKSDWIAARDS